MNAGTRAVFVHTESAFAKTPLFTIDQKSIAERAQEYVARWRSEGRDPGFASGMGTDNFAQSNVYVTDTTAPYVLVISSTEKMLWNLVIAEGVKIERVVLLAPRGAGVINMPAGAELSVISGQSLQNCRITPILPVHPEAGQTQRAAAGDATARQGVATRRQVYSSFADWFRTSFNTSLSEVSYGGERAAHFLIGPVPITPEKRIPYRGLKGAELMLTQSDHYVFGTQGDYRAKNMELVLPMAKSLAGGDLSKLNKK
jgi:hypothetical protein